MFVPFKVEHIRQIAAQEAQQHLAPWIEGKDLSSLETKWSYTYLKDGRPRACIGATLLWPGRGEVWAYLDQAAGSDLLAITREARNLIVNSEFNRLEAVVHANWAAGHKWPRLLGFRLEAARMAKYFIDGSDAALYAWVR